jgi:hypothetical protein
LSTYDAHSETDCCGREKHTSYDSIKGIVGGQLSET